MGIEIPLNTMSIILQNRRESNQEGSSKQIASTTPPLVKLPQSQWQQRLQDFKNQIKRSVGTESMQDAPLKGTESIQSASLYNTGSQQTLYLKEILTRELEKK